jgi:hypothetical protein
MIAMIRFPAIAAKTAILEPLSVAMGFPLVGCRSLHESLFRPQDECLGKTGTVHSVRTISHTQ